MALLNHLDQINLSAKSIGELDFAPSKPFTNALLHNQEITALIRDTEPHERGLFSLDPNSRNGIGSSSARSQGADTTSRRRTAYGNTQSQPSAVARVLGNDMLRQIRSSNRDAGRGGGVDIEILLQGAERLCAAYQTPGTMDRIAALRQRHDKISTSIRSYEGQISQQQSSMNRFNTGSVEEDVAFDANDEIRMIFNEQDLAAEDAAIKELEAKKKALEARVAGMERDLGGLMR